MASLLPCCFFFFLLSLVSIFPVNSSLTIPLSRFYKNPSQDPYQKLNSLVSSSLSRAFHLKNPQTTTTKTSLSSHSYGDYSISLSFGTPPQTVPFIFDTGSDLVWFPCTARYLCENCSFADNPPTKIPSFIPRKSSSSKILGCHNPKCAWIHDQNLKCGNCGSRKCTQTCPPYLVVYGSGNTGGIALSETLNLPNRTIPDFLVGCSVASYRQPAGIAGFGRGQSSLPSQLSLDKFSFCLLSRELDDTNRTSSLSLDTGSRTAEKTSGLVYTPFIDNPRVPGRSAFSVYYYLGLRRITVGGRHVKVPFKYLLPGNGGNGGTIIDSGTTITFMTRRVLEPLIDELVAQVKHHGRLVDAEVETGLSLCLNISGAITSATFPELRFHFKGGADMLIPLANSFALVDRRSIVCLAVIGDGVGDGGPDEAATAGPAIILGSFQMQNYYVEYDLKNERLGFKRQKCG